MPTVTPEPVRPSDPDPYQRFEAACLEGTLPEFNARADRREIPNVGNIVSTKGGYQQIGEEPNGTYHMFEVHLAATHMDAPARYCMTVAGFDRATLSCEMQRNNERHPCWNGHRHTLNQGRTVIDISARPAEEPAREGVIFLKPGIYRVNTECPCQEPPERNTVRSVTLQPLPKYLRVMKAPQPTPNPVQRCGQVCATGFWDQISHKPDHLFLADLKAAFREGASLPGEDYLWARPIEYAAWSALHPGIIRTLLEQGASPEGYRGYESPLTGLTKRALALRNPEKGPWEKAKLIEYSRSDERTEWLESLSTEEMEKMLISGVEALLEHGADPWSNSADEISAIATYLFEVLYPGGPHHSNELLRTLLRHGGIKEGRLFGEKMPGRDYLATMLTVGQAGPDTIRAAHETGVPADTTFSENRTWLHYVSTFGSHPDVAKFLLENGTDPRQEDDQGYTACDILMDEEARPDIPEDRLEKLAELLCE